MKRACVIVAATEPARVAEALRAAVGLCLRGGGVQLLLGPAARALVDGGARADISRAVATLAELGQEVADAGPEALARATAAAHLVERWTDGGAEGAIDDAEGLRHVVAPGRALLVRGPGDGGGPGTIAADRRTGRFFAGGRAVDSDAAIALLFAADAAIVW